MFATMKSRIRRHLSNLPGWRTGRKIVVIESDDWGSIRMPSREVFDALSNSGVDLTSGDSLRYNRYDSLATADDLSSLFETLCSVKDKNGRPCVFTPITLTANPDFEKIKAAGFEQYVCEPFTETLNRYPGCKGSFALWKEGIQKGLFVPQFHGREHLNVSSWMRSLQAKHNHTRLAFNHRMWGFIIPPHDNVRVSFQAAFDVEKPDDIYTQEVIVKEGLELFNALFGYSATYFVPPNGPFNRRLEKAASEEGVKYMSASKIQKEPQGNGREQKVINWLGKRNIYGQYYITRNCFFEPSLAGQNWVDKCLNDISIAFRWNKPAIISSHRVNYIGAIDPSNRDTGLKQLKILLHTIMKKWQDVEFMTTDKLGDQISQPHEI